MQAIDVEERRARLAVRHRLAPASRSEDDVAAIARSVVALHATDPVTGNAGPTVCADGRVVGAWGQRPDGEISLRLLEDIGADHERLLDDEAARVRAALEGIVVKPRFTSPLSKDLST